MTNLFFYRAGDTPGSRQRWRFTVDAQQNIISEVRDDPPVGETVASKSEDGRVTVTQISDADRRVLGFFSLSTPCWFKECETLRSRYREELKTLGVGCPECQKGALIRKYQALVRKAESSPEPATPPIL